MTALFPQRWESEGASAHLPSPNFFLSSPVRHHVLPRGCPLFALSPHSSQRPLSSIPPGAPPIRRRHVLGSRHRPPFRWLSLHSPGVTLSSPALDKNRRPTGPSQHVPRGTPVGLLAIALALESSGTSQYSTIDAMHPGRSAEVCTLERDCRLPMQASQARSIRHCYCPGCFPLDCTARACPRESAGVLYARTPRTTRKRPKKSRKITKKKKKTRASFDGCS